MAAGSGVVLAGDNPGYRSVLGERPELLVDPRNTKEFAQRLSSFLTNNQQARQINVWQSETVKQYDIAAVGPRILKLYSGQIARLAKKSNNKPHG
jgi:phosphatidylinositol alpha-mannosyltransferase